MDKPNLDKLNAFNKNTLMEVLGIEYLDAKPGYVKARMPVDHRTHQPMGLLHGGASMALAETVGSFGSALMFDLEKYDVRGLSMTTNHVRSVKDGWVYAEAKLVHKGRTTHIWDIQIVDEEGRTVSICRLTNFIMQK